MKKNKMFTLLTISILVLGSLSLTSYANTEISNKVQKKQEKLLTPEEANKIILKEYSNGKIFSSRLEKDYGRLIYEIELYDDNYEKEVEIDATSGQILKTTSKIKGLVPDREIHNEMPRKRVTMVTPNETQQIKTISMEEAKKIALSTSLKANIISIGLDSKKGFPIYEIELSEGNIKREIKIDAVNGNVIRFDTKHKMSHNINAEIKITMEEAKKIALENSKNGIVKSIELKNKKGLPYYEIEISEGLLEKEFKIDAINGNILKVERDF